MTRFPGPRKPNHQKAGLMGRTNSRQLGRAVSQAEGDRIALAVLELVQKLTRSHLAAVGLEPTGIHVSPDMREYVDRGAA